MKTLTYSCLLALVGATFVLAADPAAACSAPPSGTGVTTCEGSFPVPGPSTSGGPVCVNTLCPGLTSSPGTALCANVWSGGNNLFQPDLCVPFVRLDQVSG